MKHPFSLVAPTIAAVTVVSLTALTVFAAGPTSTPTGGNVDANFNSLSIGPIGAETLLLNSAGQLSTKAGDFNPVLVNDTYGLRLESTVKGFESICASSSCTGAGNFISDGNSGISAYANGGSGIGGSFYGTFLGGFGSGTGPGSTGLSGNGAAKGVAGTATAGTGGEFTGTTYGVQATASAAGGIGVAGTSNGVAGAGVIGTSSGNNGKGMQGSSTGNLGIGVFGNISGAGAANGIGVSAQVQAGAAASALAGSFVNQVSSKNAYLGTNSNALEALGESDLRGIIRNTSVTSGGEVRVEDTNGFSVTVPTAPVRFKVDGANGALSNPTPSEPSKVVDAEGLSVSSGVWNSNTSLDLQGRLYNNSATIYSGVVAIDDADGFGIFNSFPGYTSAANFKVSASGDIGHPGLVCGNPPTCSFFVNTELKVTDDEGLLIANNAGVGGVAAKTLLGNYKSSADFTGSFMFGPTAYPSMLTDFNTTGGVATNGAIYSSGVLIKNPMSGLTVDSDAGGLTVTTKTGGATIYSSGSGGLTVNTNTGGLMVSKNNGTFLGQPTATIDSATGNIASAGNIGATDGTNMASIYNNGWIAAYGGWIYTAATDWSNYVFIKPTGDIDASGHIRAAGGIGSIYSVSGTTGSCTGALCMSFSSASCGSNQVLSCEFSVNSNGAPMYNYYIGNVCYLGGKNWAGGGTLTSTSYAKCFDPNG